MRYSSAIAALFIGVAAANMQKEEGGKLTAYSTALHTVTDCDDHVKECPNKTHTNKAAVETPHPTTPVSHPAKSTSTPVVKPKPSEKVPEEEPHLSVSVVHSEEIPSHPTACPVCPSAVTIYITSIPTPGAPVPTGGPHPSVPISAIHSEPIYPAPIHSGPVHPAPINSAPVHPAPINSAPVHPAPTHSVPVHPGPVNLAPVHFVPVPSGHAPAGTGASSGFVTGPQPTSSPIAAFTGSASTVGKSVALAGLATFAAIFLI